MLTPSLSAHFFRARRASAPTCSIWGFVRGRPAFLVCRITTSSTSTCAKANRTILARSPLTRDSSVIASLRSMGRRSVKPGRSSFSGDVLDLRGLTFLAATICDLPIQAIAVVPISGTSQLAIEQSALYIATFYQQRRPGKHGKSQLRLEENSMKNELRDLLTADEVAIH